MFGEPRAGRGLHQVQVDISRKSYCITYLRKYKRKVIVVDWEREKETVRSHTVSNSSSQKPIASYRADFRRETRNGAQRGLSNVTREPFLRNNSRASERTLQRRRGEGNVEYEDTRRECMPRANYRRRRAGRAYLYTGGTLAPSSRCARSRSRRTAPLTTRVVDEHRLLDLPWWRGELSREIPPLAETIHARLTPARLDFS